MTIFSVADYSIWDVFMWRQFAPLFAIAALFLVFPKISEAWPFSSVSLFGKLGRWNALIVAAFISVLLAVHFFATAHPLNKQKRALSSANFEVLHASFDGQKPDKEVAWMTVPEMTLTFDGVDYDVSGSLHGSIDLLRTIRSMLREGQVYRLSVAEGVILKIETVP
jgi:hypothetical protein